MTLNAVTIANARYLYAIAELLVTVSVSGRTLDAHICAVGLYRLCFSSTVLDLSVSEMKFMK